MSDTDSDTASSVGSIVEDASEPDVTNCECLFCNQEFTSVLSMFEHCETLHEFPIRETIKDVGSSTGPPSPLPHLANHVTQNWKKLVSLS